MACADTGGNLGLIAAALSALTERHIVSKSEYLTIQKRAQSGIDTGYIFKGEVNVPQVIEQTYADTIDATQERSSRWKRLASYVVMGAAVGAVGLATGGVGLAIGVAGVATSTIIGGAVVAIGGTVAAAGGAGVATVGATELIIDKVSPTIVEGKRAPKSNESVQICVSSSNGETICVNMPSNMNTVHELKSLIKEKFGIKTEDQCLSYQGTLLRDTKTLQVYDITNNSTVMLTVKVRGGSQELHFLDFTYMDPSWDYDFTDVSDGDNTFIRGGYPYYRPCGWKRIAIKVTGKYKNESWLGHTNSWGEWAVTYHGTKQPVFDNICKEGYKVGTRNAYGKGVYSSPNISVAEGYASEFNYEGVRYSGVFQNRVNPKGVKIVKDVNYWVCPNPTNIRPYGLCVKAL